MGSILQFLGGILMVVTYIPNIIMLFKSKSSENQSKGFYSILSLALLFFTINGFIIFKNTGDLSIFLSQLANFILAFMCLAMLVYYEWKEK